MSVQYNQLVELGRDKKMIAAAEVGAAPLPDQLQAYQTNWLWFAVWGDTFINNQEWNSIETLKKAGPHVLRMQMSLLTWSDLHQRLRLDVGRDSGMARLRRFLFPVHCVEHFAAHKACYLPQNEGIKTLRPRVGQELRVPNFIYPPPSVGCQSAFCLVARDPPTRTDARSGDATILPTQPRRPPFLARLTTPAIKPSRLHPHPHPSLLGANRPVCPFTPQPWRRPSSPP